MSSSLPISIGITNSHWAKFCFAHVAWLRAGNVIDQETYNDSKKVLDDLSNTSPEPSFANFKERAIKVLSQLVVRELVSIPEKFALHTANIMVIKDNNDVALKKYSEYRDNLKDTASGNLELFQILDNKVTTVGYQFALFYNTFKTILENLTLSRKYVEFINNDITLVSYLESYMPDKLDFIAQKLEISNVTSFATSTLNWFISSMKEFAVLVKAVIPYVDIMLDKKLLEVDTALLAKALNAADALLATKVNSFEFDFSIYSKMFINMDDALTNMNEVISTMKLNLEAFEKESALIEKTKYYPIVTQLALRIFK